jgi:hypothetical protein
MAAIDKSTIMIPALPTGMNPGQDGAPLWVQNLTKEAADGGWVTRPGFGLVARLDSALTAGKLTNTTDLGIARVLGRHAFTTNYGDDLVVVFSRVQGWVTNSTSTLMSQRGTVYALHVYNLTKDSFTEHLLHHHTSEDSLPLWERHGHFDTDIDDDRQHWYDAGQGALLGSRLPVDDERPWFCVTGGQLLFGSTRAGAWVYSPGLPSDNRQQANSIFARDWKEPYSEDGSVVPLEPREGVFGEGYTYLTPDEFGRPTAAVRLADRVVYAVGNLLLYSDPGEPSAIAAQNVDQLPNDITALASRYGVLYAFTANSVHLVNPASGFIISGGSISAISTEVGCLGPACVTDVGGSIVFLHTSGVYAVSGSTGIERISDAIAGLFEGEGLENLWTRLYSQTITSTGATPPQSYYQWSKQSSIGAYLDADDQGRLFFGMPVLNLALVFEGGGWHAWNLQTVANDSSSIDAISNLPYSQIVCLGSRVLLVTGVTEQAQTDESDEYGGGTTGYSNPNRSFAICELGRGGSLDRSSGTYEDKRRFSGEYVNDGTNDQTGVAFRDRGFFVVKPPVDIEPGTSFPWAGVTLSSSDKAFYLPIELVPPTATIDPGVQNLTGCYMKFWFDNTNFQPVINSSALANYEALFNLPPERLAASPAYSLGVASSATPEGVMVYNSSTGLPDANGDEIRIYVSSAFGGAWTGHPEFAFNARHRNPLLSLVFKRRSGASGAIFAMGFQYIDGSVTDSSPATTQIECISWRDAPIAWKFDWEEAGDNNAQAVDWGVHAQQIAFDGIQLKARGLTFEMQSSGQATPSEVASSWPKGLLNVAMAASRKDRAGQLVDLTVGSGLNTQGITVFGHDGLLARAKNTAGDLVQPTFNNGLTWGDDADANSGNFYVADTATDSVTTTGDMKGDKLSVSFWGHIRDKAERMKFYAAKAIVRAIGGAPRRRGH